MYLEKLKQYSKDVGKEDIYLRCAYSYFYLDTPTKSAKKKKTINCMSNCVSFPFTTLTLCPLRTVMYVMA